MAYLFQDEIGWGKFKPFIRYQKFDADGVTTATSNVRTGADTKRVEIGTSYVIAPYNAMITASYGKTDLSNASDTNDFKVALQMQF